MKEQVFHIPFPPTANTMWRVYSRRIILSEAYRNWKDEAGTILMLQRPRPMVGPVRIEIRLHRRGKRKWDADNRVKPIFDLLVSHLILPSDDSETIPNHEVFRDDTIDPGAQVTITKVAA